MNKTNKTIITQLNELLDSNNNDNINKLIDYCEKCSINQKIDYDIKKIINSNIIEELFIEKILCNKNIDKYYKLYIDILDRDNISKLYLSVIIYTNQYMKSINLYNENIKNSYISNKMDDLIYNLNDNKELLDNIKNQKIKIEELVLMEPYELNYELWRKHKQRKDMIQFKKDNMATTDLYTCKKCKEKKCVTWQLQTRSADEPMTIFVQCTICQYTFKIG